jgi:hypothetical protein
MSEILSTTVDTLYKNSKPHFMVNKGGALEKITLTALYREKVKAFYNRWRGAPPQDNLSPASLPRASLRLLKNAPGQEKNKHADLQKLTLIGKQAGLLPQYPAPPSSLKTQQKAQIEPAANRAPARYRHRRMTLAGLGALAFFSAYVFPRFFTSQPPPEPPKSPIPDLKIDLPFFNATSAVPNSCSSRDLFINSTPLKSFSEIRVTPHQEEEPQLFINATSWANSTHLETVVSTQNPPTEFNGTFDIPLETLDLSEKPLYDAQSEMGSDATAEQASRPLNEILSNPNSTIPLQYETAAFPAKEQQPVDPPAGSEHSFETPHASYAAYMLETALGIIILVGAYFALTQKQNQKEFENIEPAKAGENLPTRQLMDEIISIASFSTPQNIIKKRSPISPQFFNQIPETQTIKLSTESTKKKSFIIGKIQNALGNPASEKMSQTAAEAKKQKAFTQLLNGNLRDEQGRVINVNDGDVAILIEKIKLEAPDTTFEYLPSTFLEKLKDQETLKLLYKGKTVSFPIEKGFFDSIEAVKSLLKTNHSNAAAPFKPAEAGQDKRRLKPTLHMQNKHNKLPFLPQTESIKKEILQHSSGERFDLLVDCFGNFTRHPSFYPVPPRAQLGNVSIQSPSEGEEAYKVNLTDTGFTVSLYEGAKIFFASIIESDLVIGYKAKNQNHTILIPLNPDQKDDLKTYTDKEFPHKLAIIKNGNQQIIQYLGTAERSRIADLETKSRNAAFEKISEMLNTSQDQRTDLHLNGIKKEITTCAHDPCYYYHYLSQNIQKPLWRARATLMSEYATETGLRPESHETGFQVKFPFTEYLSLNFMTLVDDHLLVHLEQWLKQGESKDCLVLVHLKPGKGQEIALNQKKLTYDGFTKTLSYPWKKDSHVCSSSSDTPEGSDSPLQLLGTHMQKLLKQ